MTKNELNRCVKALEKQGARSRRTKSGWMLYLPDGSTASLHLSPSDWRANRNLRSHVERAGLSWV